MIFKIPDIICVSRDKVVPKEKALMYLCLFLWCPAILDLIRVIFFLKTPLLSEIHLYVIPFTITCLVLLCASIIIRAVRFWDLVFFLSFVFYYELCFHLYSSRLSFLETYEELFIFQSLPYYVIGLIVKPYKFKRVFFVASAFYILYCFIFFTLMNGGSANRDMGQEQMYLAYLVLPHLLYVTWYTLTEFSFIALAFTLLGFFELLSYGNRGSLICLAALYIIFALYRSKEIGYKLVLVIIILSSLIITFSYEIILSLQGFLSSLGLSTRLFDLLAEGEMFSNTSAMARDDINYRIIQEIIKNEGVPAGFCADRPLLSDLDQIYSHNVVLEILLTFGYYIGGILLLLFIVLFVKALKNVHSNEEFCFGAVLFCCSVIKLLVSGTFVSEPMLYFFVGYCVSLIRKKQIKQ